MNVFRFSSPFFTVTNFRTTHRQFVCSLRSSSIGLPFGERKPKYYEHLETAVDVVERACRLCVDVQKSLFSSDGKIVEKLDQTPVTIADFGVQALVSLGTFHLKWKHRKKCIYLCWIVFSVCTFGLLEMSKLFPSIPLVAEEDSGFLRENNLGHAVFEVVSGKSSLGDRELNQDDVLTAIDRGGKDAFVFGPKPATYWILDPIDGTRGFVKGRDALYVVGLALVVEGEIVLGVMGCPNWKDDHSNTPTTAIEEDESIVSRSGIIMISHIGHGTWRTRLWDEQVQNMNMAHNWTRCLVDGLHQVQEAIFCIPESQKWESFPLSTKFNATTDANHGEEKYIFLLSTCCGSLCKYLMVASGKASAYIQRVRSKRIIRVWDHAAGLICIHEAGGKVTDWNGTPLDFAADETERRVLFPYGGILVTNDILHKEILELVSSS